MAPVHTEVRVAYLCTRIRTTTGQRWCAVVRQWYEYEYRYYSVREYWYRSVPVRTGSAEDSVRVRRNISRPGSYYEYSNTRNVFTEMHHCYHGFEMKKR